VHAISAAIVEGKIFAKQQEIANIDSQILLILKTGNYQWL